jgi:hypothetical protein
MTDKQRYLPAGRGKYRIVFEKRVEEAPRRVIASAPVEENPLVTALIERGLHRDSAKKLVAEHKPEVITERIEAFDWLMKTKDKPEKPSGYLFMFIEKEFPLPDGFLASRRVKATTDRKRQEAAEDTRKRREEAERFQAERRQEESRRDRVNQFLASLPSDRREAFEAAALSDGPSELVETYRKSLDNGFRVFTDNLRYQLLDYAISQLPSVLPAVVSASA